MDSAKRKSVSALQVLGWIGLGSALACAAGLLILTQLGLEVGSQPSLPRIVPLAEPIATLVPETQDSLPGTTITIWFLDDPRFFPAETIFADDLLRGYRADGALAYYIAFDEAGFNRYLSYWFAPDEGDAVYDTWAEVRDPHIDLLPGSLMFSGDMKVAGDWQSVGLLYELDETGTQLVFRGVTLGETMITTAPESVLDNQLGPMLEQLSNRALSDLVFIDEQTGAELTIRQLYIDDDRAEVLAVDSAFAESAATGP